MARPTLEHSLSVKSNSNTIKFLCSYGGKILPRYPDGKLRYHGGHTRVLSVHRSISFSELLIKMKDLSGVSSSITIRCQLPTEDLDALITIKSDEDLANLIEEYDHITTSSMKVRAFILSSHISKTTPSSSSSSSSSLSPSPSRSPSSLSPSSSFSAVRSSRQQPVMAYPSAMCYEKKNRSCQNCSSQFYLVHNGNYWQ